MIDRLEQANVSSQPAGAGTAVARLDKTRLFANRWWIVVASILGVIVGQGPITIFSFSVFLKPVTGELGISRGTMSSALLLLTIAAALTTPIVGRLIDHHGITTALLPLIVLFALSTAALSFLTRSVLLMYMLFLIQGIFSASQTPTGYVKAISAWFDRRRGLALGIAMAGSGLASRLCRSSPRC